jgi:hypothetical protein
MNDYKHSYNAVSIATNRCQESHGAMTALQTGPHFLVATCHPPSSSCCASGSKVHSVSIVHSVPPAAVCGHSSLRFSPADSRISVAADSRRKSAGAFAALLVSGWRILALWRYAARISASVQPRSTPTIRNRSSPGVRSVAVPRPPSASRGAGARLLLPPRCGGVNADTARTIIVQGASRSHARCQQGAYANPLHAKSFLRVAHGAAGRPGLRLLMRRTLHSHFSGGPPFSLWPFYNGLV